MNILSFGGGVQTVAMALMSVNGDLPMPDYSIFADPGWEAQDTYKYLEWFIPYCEERGMKFRKVSGGNIRKDALDTEKRWVSMPLFTLNKDGSKGMIRRQCTNDYKVQPVYKEVRKLLGLKPYQRTKTPARVWLGISIDEISRMKPSRVGYAENVFPFIENEISRNDCLKYLKEKGFEPPVKSSCIGCPYHSDHTWKKMKETSPEEFKDVCDFDNQIRFNSKKGTESPMYLHSRCIPLEEINFSSDQMDFFDNECEGYCGL